MHLLRASEVQTSPGDRGFHYSRVRAALLAAIVLSSACALIVWGWKQTGLPHYLSYCGAAMLLLLLLFLRGYFTARFKPTNWLVRMTPSGLFIKFRSYLNCGLPDGDETVVWISYGEIRSARLLYQRAKVPDFEGQTVTKRAKVIELELAGDTTALRKAIKAELLRSAPEVKRWYGTTSTLYGHYPVRLVPSSFLQLEWSVVPGWSAFLDSLRPFTNIMPPLVVSEDFCNLVGLSRDQQEQLLRELDARGETMVAVYTARRLFGYDLQAATSFIHSLRSGQATD
jgi:hypothetical protein